MFLGPTNTAGKIETAFFIIVAVAVALLVIVTFFMILFLIRYNRKRHPSPEHVKENTLLEVFWTAAPTVLVIVMFYFGWVDFNYIRNPPKDALAVSVFAQQWSWLFEYENGKQSDVLNVPVNRNIKLVMTSMDVIHSLFIPAFRIKEDCVPGMKTHLWFSANETGSFDIFCTEYCGVGHSHMRSKVAVMSVEDFNKWYHAAEPEALAAGMKLLQSKGCLACHSLDGTSKIGPTFKGLFGKKVFVMTAGIKREITADDAYLKKSILQPQADIVEGYPPVMPGLPLEEKELEAIVKYIETLS